MDKHLYDYKVKDIWFAQYLNRSIKKGKEYLFNKDLYPYSTEDWFNPVLMVRIATSDAGTVERLSYFKHREISGGHGKAQISELSISNTDKKRICKIAREGTEERVTVSTVDDLIVKASSASGGWKIARDRQDVSFSNGNSSYSIPCKTIIEYLEISHSFIEILSNDDFWEANGNYLPDEYREPLFYLFSFVDPISYDGYEKLKEEAVDREYRAVARTGYFLLCEAIRNGDPDEIAKYQCYAHCSLFGNGRNAVEEAILVGNFELADKLISQNAYCSSGSFYTCIDSGSLDLFKKMINGNHDTDLRLVANHIEISKKNDDFLRAIRDNNS